MCRQNAIWSAQIDVVACNGLDSMAAGEVAKSWQNRMLLAKLDAVAVIEKFLHAILLHERLLQAMVHPDFKLVASQERGELSLHLSGK